MLGTLAGSESQQINFKILNTNDSYYTKLWIKIVFSKKNGDCS